MSNPTRRTELKFELAPSERPGRIAFHGMRWVLLVGLAALTYLLFPVVRGFVGGVVVTDVGDVAPEEVIAPFEFVVMKSAEEMERENAAVDATLAPTYDLRAWEIDTVLATADVVFAALDTAETGAQLQEVAASVGLQLNLDQAEYLEPRRDIAEPEVTCPSKWSS